MEMTKENLKTIAQYFDEKLKKLRVAQNDYKQFIEWTKKPGKAGKTGVTKKQIISDSITKTGDSAASISELEILLKDTEYEISVIEPLYEMTKEYLK